MSATLLVGSAVVAAASWPVQLDNGQKDSELDSIVAVDSHGNVVTAAHTERSGGSDWFVAKFNRTGSLVWNKFYGNSVDNETPIAMEIDAADNIFITGRRDAPVKSDILTVKFTPGGKVKWSQVYAGTNNSDDIVEDLKLTSDGDVVITGYRYISDENGYQMLTAKYSSAGALVWVNGYSSGHRADFGFSLAVNSAGEVYVGGRFATSDTNYDFGVVKYDALGNQSWSRHLGGIPEGFDSVRIVALDSAENIVLSGISDGNSGTLDYLVAKYEPSGQKLWQARIGSNKEDESLVDMKMAPDDSIYVTGSTYGGDIFTAKVSGDGIEQWGKYYRGDTSPGPGSDYASGLVLSNDGAIYVGGSHQNATTSRYSVLAIKYTPAGQRTWVKTSSPDATLDATSASVAYDSAHSHFYVAGQVFTATEDFDVYIARF